MKYVDGYVFARSEEKPGGLPPHGAAGGQGLAGSRGLGIPGMCRRRSQNEDGGLVPGTIKLKAGETVVFSWIVFKSRAQRDSVNAKVMKDPRLAKLMDMKSMPFDCKRMVYGGFKTMVDLIS